MNESQKSIFILYILTIGQEVKKIKIMIQNLRESEDRKKKRSYYTLKLSIKGNKILNVMKIDPLGYE